MVFPRFFLSICVRRWKIAPNNNQTTQMLARREQATQQMANRTQNCCKYLFCNFPRWMNTVEKHTHSHARKLSSWKIKQKMRNVWCGCVLTVNSRNIRQRYVECEYFILIMMEESDDFCWARAKGKKESPNRIEASFSNIERGFFRWHHIGDGEAGDGTDRPKLHVINHSMNHIALDSAMHTFPSFAFQS